MNDVRESLVIDNILFADKIAYKKKRHLPNFVNIDELKSAAYMGLVDAATKFDTEKGIFSTYAFYRISGAINDYLRELDWGKRGSNLNASSLDNDGFSLKDVLEQKEESDYNEFIEHVAPSEKAEEILRKYFVYGFSLKEIAEDYGVSESRICQLMATYKSQIRQRWTRDELWAEIAA